MNLRSLLAGVPLTGAAADLDMEISSISYDSRTLRPGALFVALPGDKTDGHRYIGTALEKGAAAWIAADCLLLPMYAKKIRVLSRWQAARERLEAMQTEYEAKLHA